MENLFMWMKTLNRRRVKCSKKWWKPCCLKKDERQRKRERGESADWMSLVDGFDHRSSDGWLVRLAPVSIRWELMGTAWPRLMTFSPKSRRKPVGSKSRKNSTKKCARKESQRNLRIGMTSDTIFLTESRTIQTVLQSERITFFLFLSVGHLSKCHSLVNVVGHWRAVKRNGAWDGRVMSCATWPFLVTPRLRDPAHLPNDLWKNKDWCSSTLIHAQQWRISNFESKKNETILGIDARARLFLSRFVSWWSIDDWDQDSNWTGTTKNENSSAQF